MKGFMFGFVPLDDPQASEERVFPAHLASDVIAAARFRELRQQLGLTKSDVARAAQTLDLPWHRGIVYAIERFGFGGQSSNPSNPQSGTRRLTLSEVLAVPKVFQRACEMRGIPYEPIHPLWFLPKETYYALRNALIDPSSGSTTWS